MERDKNELQTIEVTKRKMNINCKFYTVKNCKMCI